MQQTATIMDQAPQTGSVQKIGLVLGPLAFGLMMVFGLHQTVMEEAAWRVAAVCLWMAIWWSTEAIPVPVTALLPIVVFDPLGIASIKIASAPYANPIIYLYLGGFLMALTVERWHLHKRIALVILSKVGTDGKRIVGAFMLTAAVTSMWMTNTSTTLMLLPIAISVVGVICENMPGLSEKTKVNFQASMMLGLAYAATIGGLATLVGTPPNALLAGFLQESYNIEISFADWMIIGVPTSMVMLFLAWFLLTKFVFPVNFGHSPEVMDFLTESRSELGDMTTAEKRIATLFLTVVLLWLVRRPLLEALGITGLSDSGIVMAAAIAIFFLPSGDKSQRYLMDWKDVSRLPWGVLLLFGGGLSLAAAFSETGLAYFLGKSLVPLGAFGTPVLIFASVALVIFLTELTSNLATTAALLPIMGAIAVEAGLDPLTICVPIAIAASCAFMLPVATPPNAIVFASGMLRIPQMARAGLVLNLVGIIWVTIIALYLAPAALG